MLYVFVFSGPIAVGKSSTIEELLNRFCGKPINTPSPSRTGATNERGALQKAGDELDDMRRVEAEKPEKLSARLRREQALNGRKPAAASAA
jgi:hypothetical protein